MLTEVSVKCVKGRHQISVVAWECWAPWASIPSCHEWLAAAQLKPTTVADPEKQEEPSCPQNVKEQQHTRGSGPHICQHQALPVQGQSMWECERGEQRRLHHSVPAHKPSVRMFFCHTSPVIAPKHASSIQLVVDNLKLKIAPLRLHLYELLPPHLLPSCCMKCPQGGIPTVSKIEFALLARSMKCSKCWDMQLVPFGHLALPRNHSRQICIHS